MKLLYFILLLCFIRLLPAVAQQKPPLIRFKEGAAKPGINLSKRALSSAYWQASRFKEHYYAIIRFNQLPDAGLKNSLLQQGIRLCDYLSSKSYMAEIDTRFSPAALSSLVEGIYEVPADLKIQAKLKSFLEAGGDAGTIAVSYFGTADRVSVTAALVEAGGRLVDSKIIAPYSIFITASTSSLKKIARLPFVAYLSRLDLHAYPLNNNNRAIHALDALSAPSGRNLLGQGITLGIGDNADPSTHIDFSGRLIQRNASIPDLHGTHTAGTMAGAGIFNPRYRGMAPMATIISQDFSDILANAPYYKNAYNMILTNNSYYSGSVDCPGDGEYDVLANYLDSQLDTIPSLLHVFAAGNDGQLTCSNFPPSFATVKSGFQCAKNVLSVGAIDNSLYIINYSSSRGPVNDGRIKPEIVAGGVNIYSCLPYNSYGWLSGTSMASPTVTGTLALLYQRYRQLHGGSDPTGAFVKAVACNSADDLGNPGPDFSFGFGMLNARTAVETIEKNQYFINTLSPGAHFTHTISGIPAGLQQIKIMLYWPDAPAAPYAAASLVNNLDLTVTGSDGITHYPLVLDPSPPNVNNNAVEGVDSINNIEQVVINNPPAGSYSVNVNGTSMPAGAQNYVVVYELLPASVTVEYPYGNETWVPGETETIRWSAYGCNNNGFTVEYSADNGASWTTLSNNVPAANRSYVWTVPATATALGLIRVTCNKLGYTGVSTYPFTVLGQPVVTVTNPCKGYAQLDWPAIASASSYDIMMLKGDTMQVVSNTDTNSYQLPNLSHDSTYWLSVRAVNGSSPGRRSIAVSTIPNSGACTLAGFNNDYTIDSLIYPVTGRQFTSRSAGLAQIQVSLHNLGSIPSSGNYQISYQVNGGSIVTETSSLPIGAQTVLNYSFSPANRFDFSAPGTYTIKVWIDYPGDPQTGNDSLTITIKQLQNPPLVLNPSYTEGFETATAATYFNPQQGFTGLDRFDFFSSSSNGRCRTFIDSGFARTGNRCATVDQAVNYGISSADSLIATFNLSNYSPSDQIWLNYYYRNAGIDFILPGNSVWIRGNDQAAWIAADTLSSNPADMGIYKAGKSIDVKGLLAQANPSQTISSSFQVKFGEEGYTSTNSAYPTSDIDNGYSFDDITISYGANDAGMISLSQPVYSPVCNLTNAEAVNIQVKNYSSNTLINVPVSYSINGTIITEIIDSIPGTQTISYTFNQKADLSAYLTYTLRTWVSAAGDTYHSNDTLNTISFTTTPFINSYPYLEGFENNNGYWYTGGINDSWQWGTPSKQIINRAANGTKVWVTSLTGNYNNNELSYLYSPCFNLSSLSNPVLSFSHQFQTEDDCSCDYHWVEYSTNDSVWIKLGAAGSGTNWYDDSSVQAWQLSDTIWHVSSIDIPVTSSKVRFRFVMYSDPATNYEGVAIDDIHIFEKAPVYNGSNTTLTQNVAGSGWIDFELGGQRIASLNPNGQQLGSTQVSLFIDTGAVRDTSNQYYLARNLVIRPANPVTAPVGIRFYFLDSEANQLIQANTCSTCSHLHDAYLSGVTEYSSSVAAEEDSTLVNNRSGNYQYYKPQQQVQIIPNDNGYYAEFSATGFSEFWINNGGLTQDRALAAVLQNFTATLVPAGGLLQWSTYPQAPISYFIVQKSNDSVNFNDMATITAMSSADSIASYQLTDNRLWNGNNYYRLKIYYNDGHWSYSIIRVLFMQDFQNIIILYPNPVSQGTLNIFTSSNCQELLLYDVSGKLVRSLSTVGFQNSLYTYGLAKGMYFLSVRTDLGKAIKKLIVD